MELLANPKLLLAAVCVRDGWRFSEIIKHYNISEVEGIKLMTTLEQNFRWIPGGPLEKFMEQEVMVKFMDPKKNEPWMFRFYLRGRYSQTSVSIIQRSAAKIMPYQLKNASTLVF